MADDEPFSGLRLGLPEIAAHHRDVVSSLTLYFSNASPFFEIRFAGYKTVEVSDELQIRLDEVDMTSSLAVLAAVEAAFRIDYEYRCEERKKGAISQAFRELYKDRQRRVALDDILDVWAEKSFEDWAENSSRPRSLIGELRGAFNFRHWLAHGRYWTPKLGRRYNFEDVFELAQSALVSFPIYSVDN